MAIQVYLVGQEPQDSLVLKVFLEQQDFQGEQVCEQKTKSM